MRKPNSQNIFGLCLTIIGVLISPLHTQAQVTFAGSPSALGANDSFGWARFGTAGHIFSPPSISDVSTLSLPMTTSSSYLQLFNNGWLANYDGNYGGADGNDDIYIRFNAPVSGVGAQIWGLAVLAGIDNGGPYYHTPGFSWAILAYDTNTNLLARFDGSANWNGSIPFIGVTSTTNNIARVDFFAYDAYSGQRFSINSVSLNDSSYAPAIITQPQSVVVNAYSNTSFTVAAFSPSFAPVNYQWFFNGSPLNGATNSTLAITNATYLNQGTYQVLVSNSIGSVTSSPASLTLAPLPPPTLGVTMAGNQPVLVWQATATNYVLQMCTNLTSGDWVTVTNGISVSGFLITNMPGVNAFRLQ